jgi:hypothetical protein
MQATSILKRKYILLFIELGTPPTPPSVSTAIMTTSLSSLYVAAEGGFL